MNRSAIQWNKTQMAPLSPLPQSRFVTRLARHSPLSQLEQNAIQGLSGSPAQFPAGADIVPLGREVQCANFIVEGVVARFDQAEDGRKQVTALFVPGDSPDLSRALLPQVVGGLSAFTNCSVLRVSRAELEHLVRRYPAIQRAFWRDLAIDASISGKWVGNMALKKGESRVAHLICELATRMEASGSASKATYSLKVTQSRLAEAVGLTTVHTNRVLQHLRDNGLISDSRDISVRDWQGLSDLAGFDPTYLHLPTE